MALQRNLTDVKYLKTKLILKLERLHKARKTNVQLTTTYPISLRAKLAEAKFKEVRKILIIMK